MLMACTDPPVLSRVADALGASLRDEAEPGMGAFVSAAALVAEACGATEVDTYAFVGEGARAFQVSLAAVTVNEASGTREWNFGDVWVGDDIGNLTITTDSGRTGYTAAYSGELMSLAAEYTLVACEAGTGTAAARASVSGSGHVNAAGESAELTIGADSSVQALEWAPATAAVPGNGWVRWKVDSANLTLDPATEIEEETRLWPGVASSGEDWSSEVKLLLP
jgi:hypothetical protein